MKPCKWCNRVLEGVGVAACKGQRACTHRAAYEEGEEQGRADERAAIVRWLREGLPMLGPRHEAWTEASKARACVLDAIERGEHER